MQFSSLTAISPIDGRYSSKLLELQSLCSEFALMKFRLMVETNWLIKLTSIQEIKELQNIHSDSILFLENITKNFNIEEANIIKDLEKETNHDVKSVEYYLRKKLSNHPEWQNHTSFIHFGCTSEDINNIAYALIIKHMLNEIILPNTTELIEQLRELAHKFADVPMLARTHGQPATPTTLGKEFANFVYRLQKLHTKLEQTKISGKFNGATGNFNALYIAYPNIDWINICKDFVESFGISYNPYTTQIEPHDYIANFCNTLTLYNNILLDLNRDLWGYISLGYFKQNTTESEIGSSTMPHKVNPIEFENSEGNLGIANALLIHFANKLPISRWQRDLSDSTVMRNIGTAIAHSILAYKSTIQGLSKLTINKKQLTEDLNNHWETLTEAIQTVIRKYGIKNAYELLKEFTHGQQLNEKEIENLISKLPISEDDKKELLKIQPTTYIGKATELAKEI